MCPHHTPWRVHFLNKSSHIFNSHPLFKDSSIEATFYIFVIGSLPTVASRSPRTPRSVETSLRRKVLEKKSTNFNVSLDTSNDDDDISSQDLYHHYQPFNNTQEKINYFERNVPLKTNKVQESTTLNPTLKSVDEKIENINTILVQLESQATQLLKV